MELFVIITLCAIVILQQITHYLERKDLYNRIMANDLADYNQKPIKARTVSCAIRKNNDSERK